MVLLFWETEKLLMSVMNLLCVDVGFIHMQFQVYEKKKFLFIIPTWVFYGKICTNLKIHKNFIRHPIGLFFIISHMSLWMKKFQYVFQQNTLVNIIERTLYGGLKIWILLSCAKNNIWLTRCMCSFVKYCFATQR